MHIDDETTDVLIGGYLSPPPPTRTTRPFSVVGRGSGAPSW